MRENSPITYKSVTNFDKDLSDSLALIFLTCSHCPYITAEYFSDIFLKPDTTNKVLKCHDASLFLLLPTTSIVFYFFFFNDNFPLFSFITMRRN